MNTEKDLNYALLNTYYELYFVIHSRSNIFVIHLTTMAKIQNKEVLQSYILTTAKYDFNVYEKRILYRIIEINQYLLEGKKLDNRYIIDKSSIDTIKYTMPISAFLNPKEDKEDKNHSRIKVAFENLQKKIISYDDKENKIWHSAGIIFNVKMDYDRADKITFQQADFIYQAFMDFSKGFRKYELKIAMQFESVYSMRFYELFSTQKTPINYSIETLKEMFKMSEKYKLTSGFIRDVIDKAKKELDKCSPYTFHYEKIKTGRKITGIRFIPIYQPQFEDPELKKKQQNKQISKRWFIPKNTEDFLKHNFSFTDNELKNNLNLFEALYNNLSEDELLDFLVELREPSSYADNQKAFIIGALKKKIEQIVEQKYLKK